MLSDYLVTIGVLITIMSVPAMLSAWSEDRWPIRGVISLVIGLVVIAMGWVQAPELYSVLEIPNAVVRVLADIIK